MAWTTPKTWASLTELTASEMNTHVRDNMLYLKALADAIPFSGAQALRVTDQNVANNSAEYITLTSQNYDVGGWFAPSSTKIIVPAAAIPTGYTSIYVMAVGTLEFTTNSGAGGRMISLHRNQTRFGYQRVSGIDDGQQALTLTDFSVAEEGDEFQIEAFHTLGSTLAVVYAALSIVRIGVGA